MQNAKKQICLPACLEENDGFAVVAWSGSTWVLILFLITCSGMVLFCHADEEKSCLVALVVCEPGYRLKVDPLKLQPWTTLVVLEGERRNVGKYEVCVPASDHWREVIGSNRTDADFSVFGHADDDLPSVLYYTSPGAVCDRSSKKESIFTLRKSRLHGFLIQVPEAFSGKTIEQQVSYVSNALSDNPSHQVVTEQAGNYSLDELLGYWPYELTNSVGYRTLQRKDNLDLSFKPKQKLLVSVDLKPFINAWKQISSEHSYFKRESPETRSVSEHPRSDLVNMLRPLDRSK